MYSYERKKSGKIIFITVVLITGALIVLAWFGFKNSYMLSGKKIEKVVTKDTREYLAAESNIALEEAELYNRVGMFLRYEDSVDFDSKIYELYNDGTYMVSLKKFNDGLLVYKHETYKMSEEDMKDLVQSINNNRINMSKYLCKEEELYTTIVRSDLEVNLSDGVYRLKKGTKLFNEVIKTIEDKAKFVHRTEVINDER